MHACERLSLFRKYRWLAPPQHLTCPGSTPSASAASSVSVVISVSSMARAQHARSMLVGLPRKGAARLMLDATSHKKLVPHAPRVAKPALVQGACPTSSCAFVVLRLWTEGSPRLCAKRMRPVNHHHAQAQPLQRGEPQSLLMPRFVDPSTCHRAIRPRGYTTPPRRRRPKGSARLSPRSLALPRAPPEGPSSGGGLDFLRSSARALCPQSGW